MSNSFSNSLLILGSIAANYNQNTFNISSSSNLYKKIKIWSGSSLPSGYVWCNGSNGTPDLRDKFIYGKSSVNATTLIDSNRSNNGTINVLPTHTHDISANIHSTSTSFSNNVYTHSTSGFISEFNPKKIQNVHNASNSNRVNRYGGRTLADSGHSHGTSNNTYTANISGSLSINMNRNLNSTSKTTTGIKNATSTDKLNPSYILFGLIMKA